MGEEAGTTNGKQDPAVGEKKERICYGCFNILVRLYPNLSFLGCPPFYWRSTEEGKESGLRELMNTDSATDQMKATRGIYIDEMLVLERVAVDLLEGRTADKTMATARERTKERVTHASSRV